jgi:3D (Asp-Asp-Asp) domain-containing protein
VARRHLRTARRAFVAAEHGAAERLRALYEDPEIDPLSVLLGSSSFDDALTRLDHVNRMADLDKHIAQVAQRARGQLTRLSRRLAEREARLVALRREADAAAIRLTQARTERESYIGRLAEQRRLNESEIASLEDQAAAAEQRAEEVAAKAAAAAPAPAPGPSSETSTPESAPAPPPASTDVSGRQMTVLATAYSLPGTTASGIPVGPGVVAVDPTVIPMGTRMTIPGYGEGFAADTGSAIKGARIDVWFSTYAAAAAWGLQRVTITLH